MNIVDDSKYLNALYVPNMSLLSDMLNLLFESSVGFRMETYFLLK